MTNNERIQANNAELREAIEMAENLPEAGGEANPVIEPLEVKENGTYNAPDGVDGYNPVVVNVPNKEPVLQDKTYIPSRYPDIVTADAGYDGLAQVFMEGDLDLEEKNIVEGVEIFGVTGTAEPASALAETATRQDELIAEIMTALQGKAAGGGDGDSALNALLDGSIVELNSNATSIFAHACRGRTELVSVNLTEATSINTYAFDACDKLRSVSAPKCTSVGSYVFRACVSLEEIVLTETTTLSTCAFNQCSALKKADFPSLKNIGSNVFTGCSGLEALILRTTASECKLSNINALTSTPIVSGTGYVYVPKNLEGTYKSASNWSSLASQIRAIEDYPEITGG